MANVLLGWEMGGGLGHIALLVRIAREISRMGHQPVFVIKEPRAIAATQSQANQWHVRSSPVWPAVEHREPYRANRFTDILARKGFAEPARLQPVLSQWCQILDELQPRLVISNFAPTLNLAAHQRYRQVITGTGFTVPPAVGADFPEIFPTQAADPPRDLLEAIRQVQSNLGLPLINQVTDFLNQPHAFAFTLSEVDPYHRVRSVPVDGLSFVPAPLPQQATTQSFYAYLDAQAWGTNAVLETLDRSRLSGTIFMKNVSPDRIRDRVTNQRLHIESKLIPLDKQALAFDVVVHHAGQGLSCAALAAGVPQLVLPRFLEHDLTAMALEQMGVGCAIRDDVALSQSGSILQRLITEPTYRESANDLASTIAKREQHDGFERLIACCEDLLTTDA